jgi:hypothetical protein
MDKIDRLIEEYIGEKCTGKGDGEEEKPTAFASSTYAEKVKKLYGNKKLKKKSTGKCDK